MPEPTARDFHLGDILSVITGLLLSPSGIDGVYAILNWITGDDLFTHQLPRAARECAPILLEQHPDLAAVNVPDFETEAAVRVWLAEQVARLGELRAVSAAPSRHLRIDPITEIQMMRPDMQLHTVTMPGPGESPTLARVQEQEEERRA